METLGATVMTKHRVDSMIFASVYPLLVAKADKKERTKAEVDKVMRWLTGYTQRQLQSQIKKEVDIETCFTDASDKNPRRKAIQAVLGAVSHGRTAVACEYGRAVEVAEGAIEPSWPRNSLHRSG